MDVIEFSMDFDALLLSSQIVLTMFVYLEECILQIFKYVLTVKEMGFIALS